MREREREGGPVGGAALERLVLEQLRQLPAVGIGVRALGCRVRGYPLKQSPCRRDWK